MQEEIEHKTVNFAISTTKLSARTLLRGMQFLLRQYDKHASQGKQSMKRLVRLCRTLSGRFATDCARSCSFARTEGRLLLSKTDAEYSLKAAFNASVSCALK